MKKLILLIAAFSIVALTHSQNILQSGWDFNGNTGNEVSVTATFNNTDIETSSIVRGTGLAAAALANSFSASGWTTTNSLSDAIANNDYVQFTVRPKTSFITSLSAIEAVFRRSGTGPDHFQWQYSIDGTSFINISNEISFVSTATNGVAQSLIDISAIADLQNVSSSTNITIRLYGFNASASGGTFSIGRLAGNDLALTGSTNAVTPVRLLNFSGISVRNSIELKWVSASEINNSRYEIEYSADGKKFGKIGVLYSVNAINGSSYFFRDNNRNTAKNWYRLKLVDMDEHFEYSTVILIRNIELPVLKVFNNPPASQIFVQYPATDKSTILKIIGLDGTLHQQYNLPAHSFEYKICTGNMPAGNYILVWINARRVYSTRFIVL